MSKNKVLQVKSSKINVSFLPGSNGITHPKLNAKLIPREELGALGEFLRRRGLRVAFTTGVFDMIHIGHVRYLELAKSLGHILVVGLNSDSSVKKLKGDDRPVLDEGKRSEMLSFLEAVDYITIYPEPTGGEVIKILKPNAYLCVEGSWDGDLAIKDEVKSMVKHKGEVFYTPRQDPVLSTTAIIEKIGKQYAEELIQKL